VLRNDLGLKSCKFACGLEQCGACKVLVDGKAEYSCSKAVADFQGRRIVTLEGLADGDSLDNLQQAFIEERAAQCGYCTSGMIIAAKALLDNYPQPDDSDIRQALDDNLCRCGTHPRIIKAIQRAAEKKL